MKKNKNNKDSKKSGSNVFFDAILNICDVKNTPVWLCGFILFSAFVIAFNSVYDAKSENKEFDDLKLVEAVVTDTPHYKYTEFNNKIIYSSYLPVDVDGDGERDLYVELSKNKQFKSSDNNSSLNIKKGDRIVLEGFVIGDGRDDKLMKPVGNDAEIIEGDILSGSKKKSKYLTARNIIAVENNIVNMPKNNDNVQKIVTFLNRYSR